MKDVKQQLLTGERALFKAHDLRIEDSTFGDGESPLKESTNIELVQAIFKWKYPLWYSEKVLVNDTIFEEMARSGIWYTSDIQIMNSTFQAPKSFRKSNQIRLKHVHFSNADETLWNCSDIYMSTVEAAGNYFCMNSHNIIVNKLSLVGNYGFDGAKNVEIHDSTLITKDAFWNCENVTIYDSKIVGEYFGWNSSNIKLVNCTIESDQGFCYMDNITLENCVLVNTNLAFEYCTNINAEVNSTIESVKNPISGHIHANHIQKVIADDADIITTNIKISDGQE